MSSEQQPLPDADDAYEKAGIKALANVISDFYWALRARGISEETATNLTVAYINTTFQVNR